MKEDYSVGTEIKKGSVIDAKTTVGIIETVEVKIYVIEPGGVDKLILKKDQDPSDQHKEFSRRKSLDFIKDSIPKTLSADGFKAYLQKKFPELTDRENDFTIFALSISSPFLGSLLELVDEMNDEWAKNVAFQNIGLIKTIPVFLHGVKQLDEDYLIEPIIKEEINIPVGVSFHQLKVFVEKLIREYKKKPDWTFYTLKESENNQLKVDAKMTDEKIVNFKANTKIGLYFKTIPVFFYDIESFNQQNLTRQKTGKRINICENVSVDQFKTSMKKHVKDFENVEKHCSLILIKEDQSKQLELLQEITNENFTYITPNTNIGIFPTVPIRLYKLNPTRQKKFDKINIPANISVHEFRTFIQNYFEYFSHTNFFVYEIKTAANVQLESDELMTDEKMRKVKPNTMIGITEIVPVVVYNVEKFVENSLVEYRFKKTIEIFAYSTVKDLKISILKIKKDCIVYEVTESGSNQLKLGNAMTDEKMVSTANTIAKIGIVKEIPIFLYIVERSDEREQMKQVGTNEINIPVRLSVDKFVDFIKNVGGIEKSEMVKNVNGDFTVYELDSDNIYKTKMVENIVTLDTTEDLNKANKSISETIETMIEFKDLMMENVQPFTKIGLVHDKRTNIKVFLYDVKYMDCKGKKCCRVKQVKNVKFPIPRMESVKKFKDYAEKAFSLPLGFAVHKMIDINKPEEKEMTDQMIKNIKENTKIGFVYHTDYPKTLTTTSDNI